MRPGQRHINEFEQAILTHLAQQETSLEPLIHGLHVLSREFTGVGSFTNFKAEESAPVLGNRRLGLDAPIHLPEVEYGLGAVLFCESGCPAVLEVFTYGEAWDGVHEGFTIGAQETEDER